MVFPCNSIPTKKPNSVIKIFVEKRELPRGVVVYVFLLNFPNFVFIQCPESAFVLVFRVRIVVALRETASLHFRLKYSCFWCTQNSKFS